MSTFSFDSDRTCLTTAIHKTYVYFWAYFLKYTLEREFFQTEVVKQPESLLLYSVPFLCLTVFEILNKMDVHLRISFSAINHGLLNTIAVIKKSKRVFI
jgi:hypothetical protein